MPKPASPVHPGDPRGAYVVLPIGADELQSDHLGDGGRLQLLGDMGAVGVDGARRDCERPRDLLGRAALGDQSEDLGLALRQASEPLAR